DIDEVQMWRSKHQTIEREKKLQQKIHAPDSLIIRRPSENKVNKHTSFRLRNYHVPEEVLEMLGSNELDKRNEFLNKPLMMSNYVDKFRCLLYFEEASRILEMRRFDLDSQTLSQRGEYLALFINDSMVGCFEVGNKVLLTHPTRVPQITFEGSICKILHNFLLLRFCDDFHKHYDGEAYNVSFKHDRRKFVYSHNAIDKVSERIHKFNQKGFSNSEVLFPKSKYSVLKVINMKTESYDVNNWYQKNLDKRQMNAVIGIMKKTSFPSPYVVNGKPGTGKTTTLVECVLQVIHSSNWSRILVCTASNSHADLIADKLWKCGLRDDNLVRLVSRAHMDRLPERLKQISVIATRDPFSRDWLFKRIIITTAVTAANIWFVVCFKTLFTHCFIDECTKMTEPETLLPISLTNFGNSTILLCGDLNAKPFCLSKVSRNYGLNVSFMHRLVENSPYAGDEDFEDYGGFNPKFISKLQDRENEE
ncbi:putative helicase Mov10l1-like isoform X2, partial [Leptotrombidium deliense]